ncbi:DUF4238 domain-containing protein [Novosphingobium sp.]|uniref:DUF4238 domain-containing protein n=1 Tax=Novosphingobium sp. TaxID=1874826 RepID=UPI00286EA555|nr:DUF4238 domain-containing protein [Novosphingobium sp.]
MQGKIHAKLWRVTAAHTTSAPMASNKNQHFVPKTYLRPFGNQDQRSINLYALETGRCIEGASIKKQCSRNYFYGSEPVFEDFIQFFEGRYGQAMGRLQQLEIMASDIGAMFDFFVLQYLRTPHQLSQRKEVFEAFRNTKIGGKPLRDVHAEAMKPIDDQREMQEQIYIAAKAANMLHDLRPVFLINRTKVPFVTSDNPACVTNRLYTQRYQDQTSGLIQSGTAIFLPLTSRLAFMGYDEDVFQPFGKGIEHHVSNERDVDRINELQAQLATQTLYFTEWTDREYVERLAERCAKMRRDNWAFIWTAILDGDDGEFERFRTVTEADAESTATRITAVSMYNAAPSTWPSFLKFKLRPRGYTTGSAVGFVREAHTEAKGRKRFRCVVLPLSIPVNQQPQNRHVIYMRKDQTERR